MPHVNIDAQELAAVISEAEKGSTTFIILRMTEPEPDGPPPSYAEACPERCNLPQYNVPVPENLAAPAPVIFLDGKDENEYLSSHHLFPPVQVQPNPLENLPQNHGKMEDCLNSVKKISHEFIEHCKSFSPKLSKNKIFDWIIHPNKHTENDLGANKMPMLR